MLREIATTVAILMPLSLAGCLMTRQTTEAPERQSVATYGRQLPPGDTALRLLTDRSLWPNLVEAYRDSDPLTLDALDHSLSWFSAPSSRRSFPFGDITHEQARASVEAMKTLLQEAPDAYAFAAEVERLFDCYQSVGYDDRGTVLYTGYFSPIFFASRYRSERFNAPLYRRPADLVTDELTGHPQGRRRRDGGLEPYATREEIETSGMLAGTELVWVEDDLAAYIIHINGSAKLRMEDGSVMYIGYGGKTDREYASLGAAMIEEGLLTLDEVSLSAVKRAYKSNPEAVRQLMFRNQNYVFFTEYPGGNWPAGSLGVQVTRETSLATDKSIYPRGGVILADTTRLNFSGERRKFYRFMLDQDTGGAINAPGRADIFLGIGAAAEILAGGQYAEGRLFYFFLKPQYVQNELALRAP